MRMDMTISCSSSVSFLSWRDALVKLLSRPACWSVGFDVTIDSVITISPIRSIRLSSFDRLTFMRLCLTGACTFSASGTALSWVGAPGWPAAERVFSVGAAAGASPHMTV